jgi:hypothetical protein
MTASTDFDSRQKALQSSRHLITALLIFLVGFSLLVLQLDRKSLWGDETFRAYTTAVTLGDVDEFLARVKMHVLPPLYPLCLWIWRSVAGHTEFSLRFPSVAFATISLATVYRLAVRVMGDRVGLMVLALGATSPFLVLSARMVQYYSLLLLLSATSYWLFIQLLQGQGNRAKWAGYTVVCAMALYTQYFAAFVLATQGLVALSQIRKRREFFLRILAAQAVVILLFAPALGLLIPQSAGRYGGHDAFSTSSLIISAFSLAYPFFGWTAGATIFPWNPAGLLGALLCLGLAAASLWEGVKDRRSDSGLARVREAARQGASPTRVPVPLCRQSRRDRTPGALTYLLFALLPLGLSVFTIGQFSGASGDPFVINRAIFCVPFFYILIAAGIWLIARPGPRLLVVTTLGIVFGLAIANYYLGREFHNPLYVLQSDVLANSIDDQAASGDVFLSDEMTAFGYYITKENPEAVHFPATQPNAAQQYIEARGAENVWLILICRAVDTESLATVELVPWLLTQGYSEVLRFGHSPQDRTFARVQGFILGKPACTDKIVIHKYSRPVASNPEMAAHEA